jgi:hypothetical protein
MSAAGIFVVGALVAAAMFRPGVKVREPALEPALAH